MRLGTLYDRDETYFTESENAEIAGAQSTPLEAGGASKAGLALAAGYGGPIAIAGLMGLQIWSGIQKAEMVRRQARLTQRLNDMNARAAEIDAYDAEKFGYTRASRYQSVIDATIADQRAGYAAQDVDVTFGTAAQVQEQTKHTGFLNQLDLITDARSRALGLKRQARQIRLQGGMYQSQAEIAAAGAQNSAIIDAVTTGVSGYTRSRG